MVGYRVGLLALALAAILPGRALADVSVGAWIQHSPDDINTTNIPGLLTLSGNDATASVTLPFTVTIEGAGYTTLVLSTSGWIEFGSNTSGSSDPDNACPTPSQHPNASVAAYGHA